MGLFSQGTTFASLVNSLIGIINIIIPVLLAAMLVFFFFGIVKYIAQAGGKRDSKTMLWSLIAIFVLLSTWGILRILTNTFLGPQADPSFQGTGASPY